MKRPKRWICARNVNRLTALTDNSTQVECHNGETSWQPAKPWGGNGWKQRILGAFLVLCNKAEAIRWY